MEINLSIFSAVAVLLSWAAFAGVVISRRLRSSSSDASAATAKRPWVGFTLQGVSMAIAFFFPRLPLLSPVIGGVMEAFFLISAVILAVASVWFAAAAIRELGKQWSLQARLLVGHKLITSGAYQVTRHPIYTAMLGMIIATGVVYSHPIAAVAAVVVFLIATRIRTNEEEALLKGAFAEEFAEWKARVPWLVPFTKLSR